MKPRARSGRPPPGPSRPRAGLVTLAMFLLGIVGSAYAVKQLHEMLFVASATSAKVAGPVYTVAMPRNGTFYSLVPADGVVKKGAPIAQFEAPVLDLLRDQVASADLSAEQVDRMLKNTVRGTVTSPCDCRIQAQLVADAQFVDRGHPLFELVPRNFESFVVARFPYSDFNRLSPGTEVSFRVSGDSGVHRGTIQRIRVPGDDLSLQTDVIATISPNKPLPEDLVHRPVQVSTGGLVSMPERLFDAMHRATADDAP